MNKFLLTVCALWLFVSSAIAQEKSREELDQESLRIWGIEGLRKDNATRIIPSGTAQKIIFVAWLNPDCTSAGNIIVRTSNQPDHGKVETMATFDYPSYSKQNLRSKCNQHKVKGMVVNYKADKYTGDDAFDILVMYPDGLAREIHYDINVR